MSVRSNPFRVGIQVFSNMFGDNFKRGIVLSVTELPRDSLEYCRCTDGRENIGSSHSFCWKCEWEEDWDDPV